MLMDFVPSTVQRVLHGPSDSAEVRREAERGGLSATAQRS